MNHIQELFERVSARLEALVKGNAMVGKPISVGERHVLPLCELSVGFGGGGGEGEGTGPDGSPTGGMGQGAGGGARVAPVAIIVVDGEDVRIENLS